MSTQSPYLKAIIVFPLLTQLIGSVIAYVVFELDDYREGYFDSVLFGFSLTFWPLTVPAIINAYFAKFRGYLRHHWKKILLFSFIIIFVYWSIGNVVIAPNTKYLTNRISFILGGSAIMAIYTTIFLLLLVPESKQVINMQLSQSLLDQVRALANEAGKHLARFYQQDVRIQTKSDNTPVTEADLFVSQFLIEKLTALFPDIPVLSEENCNIPFEQRQTWQTYWLIDPLDGTQQFIDRTDQFSVLITLVQNHQPVMGVIHFPILNITYYAMKGFGAFKQSDKEIKTLQPRKIDLTKPLKIAVGATTSQEKVRSILAKNLACEFTVVGSSSLKSGLVAEGAVDCYIRLGKTGEWDTAGAEILLAETNGGIFDPQFQPLTYNQRESLINPNFVMVSDNTQNWASVFQFN